MHCIKDYYCYSYLYRWSLGFVGFTWPSSPSKEISMFYLLISIIWNIVFLLFLSHLAFTVMFSLFYCPIPPFVVSARLWIMEAGVQALLWGWTITCISIMIWLTVYSPQSLWAIALACGDHVMVVFFFFSSTSSSFLIHRNIDTWPMEA